MVKILLRQDGINSDKPDNHGKTPLYLAVWFRYEKVVKVLLGLDGTSPDLERAGRSDESATQMK